MKFGCLKKLVKECLIILLGEACERILYHCLKKQVKIILVTIRNKVPINICLVEILIVSKDWT